MTIHIAALNEQDWQILKTIRLKALQADPGVFGSNYAAESAYDDAEWRSWLNSDDTGVFGVFDDGRIIGMTAISIKRQDETRRTAILWGSWLEPDYRGRGLSQGMYEARLGWAGAHPTCAAIEVSHRASNIGSKRANQKHGFVFTHAVPKQWPDGVTEDHVHYILDLGPSHPRP